MRAGAGAVALLHAVGEDVLHQIEILAHGSAYSGVCQLKAAKSLASAQPTDKGSPACSPPSPEGPIAVRRAALQRNRYPLEHAGRVHSAQDAAPMQTSHSRFRCAIAVASCALLALAGVPAAPAQADYPTKPVRIMVPFAPGGFVDFAARLVGQKLSEKWGQQVVVENRPGGNGFIGSPRRPSRRPTATRCWWRTPASSR